MGCVNGKCVLTLRWCDSWDYECSDSSDEIFCVCETRYDLVTCPGGSNFTDCLPKEWMCDGQSDCPGGTDELKCEIQSPKELRKQTG